MKPILLITITLVLLCLKSGQAQNQVMTPQVELEIATTCYDQTPEYCSRYVKNYKNQCIEGFEKAKPCILEKCVRSNTYCPDLCQRRKYYFAFIDFYVKYWRKCRDQKEQEYLNSNKN